VFLLAVSLRDKHIGGFAVGGFFRSSWVVWRWLLQMGRSVRYGMAILLFWLSKRLNFLSAMLRVCA